MWSLYVINRNCPPKPNPNLNKCIYPVKVWLRLRLVFDLGFSYGFERLVEHGNSTTLKLRTKQTPTVTLTLTLALALALALALILTLTLTLTLTLALALTLTLTLG